MNECNGDATCRTAHEAKWKLAVGAANERLNELSDDEIVTLAEIKRFQDSVNELERLARDADVQSISERPRFMTAASIPANAEEQAHLVRQIDERFRVINDCLLKAAAADLFTSSNQRVRKIGRIAHAVYERSKPLFGQLSFEGAYRHYQYLISEALTRRQYCAIRREWLEGR